MVVGEMPEGLDLLVIGAGPGGYTAALEAAELGRKVTLVDAKGADGVGGTCLLEGCIPSKALIELADLGHKSRHFAGGLLDIGTVQPDMEGFQAWKGDLVNRLSGGVRTKLAKSDVEIVAGRFTFTGPQRGVIEMGGDAPPKHVEFAHAIIAVGSIAVEIPSLRFDGESVFDAAGILSIDKVPKRLAVIGGGYIGMEIGTALRKLGSEVAVVEAAGTILPEMPTAAQKLVSRKAVKLGMEVLTSSTAEGFHRGVLVVSDANGETRNLDVDRVLVAVGRRPATRDLGLKAAGIEVDEAGRVVIADDGMASPFVAAIGDVVAGPALAHKAIAEARVAVSAVCGKPAGKLHSEIPLVVFTDPEVAAVGLTKERAEADGRTVSVVRLPMGASGRAATLDAAEGSVELVVDTETDAIVGALLIGPHMSELIGEATLAIEMAATPDDLSLTIHPHPTLSEMLQDTAGLSR